jgi:hypothetical protein
MAKAKSKSKGAAAKRPAKTVIRPKRRPVAKGGAALPGDLERRLLALARKMNKSMAALTLQALCEFADAWEDHFKTMRAMADDDRVRISVKTE